MAVGSSNESINESSAGLSALLFAVCGRQWSLLRQLRPNQAALETAAQQVTDPAIM